MSGATAPGLRAVLAAALRDAMRARDEVAVAALRSALAAVANAEAVPVDVMPAAGAVEQARVGAGAADAPRRELTADDVRAVLEAELAEHDHAARHLADVGRPEDAAGVAARATVLRAFLSDG